MGTNFTRFKCVLTAIMLCLISTGMWGQTYTETFSNATGLGGSAAYNSSTFTGVNDINWSWANCQDGNKQTTKYVIDGVTPVLRHPSSYMQAAAIEGGISSFTLQYKRAYTGASASRIVEVYVNDVLVGSGEECKSDANLRTLEVNNLTVEGAFSLKIKLQGTGTSNAQTCIDNFVWTSYSSSSSKVYTPTFSDPSGDFVGTKRIELSCVTEDAQIYYNINSAQDPTAESTLYNEIDGITINETSTIKAIAVKTGLDNSDVATATYTKILPSPTFEFSSEAVAAVLGEAFVAPSLTNTSDASPSYESSDSNVATVDNTGSVTILGVGTTTIKASVEATANFAAAEDSYILTVKNKGQVTFTIETATSVEADVEIPGVSATFNNTYSGNKQQLTKGSSMTLTVTGYPYMVGSVILSMKTNQSSGSGTINITVGGNEFFNNAYANGHTGSFKDYEISGTAGLKGDIVVKITATENSLYCESFTLVPRIQTTVVTPENVGAVTDLADNFSLTGTWTPENMTTLADRLNATITSVDMTGATLDNVTTDIFVAKNPNCLKYFAANSTYPDWVNVVEGEDALEIVLKDGYPFYNMKDFDAVEVSFERNFSHMLTEGWASLFLPFPVSSSELGDIYIEKYNRISPTENIVYFDEATAIEANTPYIVRIKTGEVKTFTGSGVIPKTPEVDDQTAGFKGTYTEIPRGEATGLYLLKVDGSAFAVATENASVPAFRAYIKYTGPSGAKPNFAVGHDGGGTTGCKPASIDGELYIYSVNGCVEINATKAQVINICALDGRIVKTMEVVEGCNIVTDLAKGVYLLNNRKFIVK